MSPHAPPTRDADTLARRSRRRWTLFIVAALAAVIAGLVAVQWWNTCTPAGRVRTLLNEYREGGPHWLVVKVAEWCGWSLWTGRDHDTIFGDLIDIDTPAVPYLAEAMKDPNDYVRWQAAAALGYLRDPAAVPALVEALGDKKWSDRGRAAEALGDIGDRRAVEPLIAALNEGESTVRGYIVRALGKIGDGRAVEPLIAVLGDAAVGVDGDVADALGKLRDPRAVGPLIAALADKDSEVVERAAWALGVLNDRRAVEPLIAVLGNVGRPVPAPPAGQGAASFLLPFSRPRAVDRMRAAWALGVLGDPRAAKPLLAALDCGDSDVRESAALALADIRDADITKPLVELLTGINSDQRSVAAIALGRIGDPQVVPALVAVLVGEGEVVDREAAEALGRIGDRRAVEPLIAALGRDWFSDEAVVKALARIGDGRAVGPLLAAFAAENGRRSEIAEALGVLGTPHAVGPLMRALQEDKEDEVRCAAAAALGEIGDPRAVPALITALEDEDSGVRRTAAWTLGLMGRAEAAPAIRRQLEDYEVSYDVGQALGMLRQPDAAPLLTDRLCWSTVYRGMLNDLPKILAAAARIESPEVRRVLRVAAVRARDLHVRRLAGRAAEVGVVNALVEALAQEDDVDPYDRAYGNGLLSFVFRGSENLQVAAHAAEALFYLADPSTREALVAAEKSKNPTVRYWARRALRRMDRMGQPQPAGGVAGSH